MKSKEKGFFSRFQRSDKIILGLITAMVLLTIILNIMGVTNMFGATSVLIMVSVALETADALDNQMLMRHYKGFLN